MNIEYWDVNDVIPYDNNPRNNDSAVDAVANSIEEFSFRQPIVVDKDGVVVVGHTRLKAAKKLGMKVVPVLVADDLTDEQIRAYRLADNKTAERATWDFELLSDELDAITTIDMSQFDFDISVDIDPESTFDEVEEDEVPDDAPSICKYGDIWQLGEHRLICGDSTNVQVIDTLMDGEKADMVFTDPPYSYNYQSNKRTKSQKFDVLENDDKILDFFPNLYGRVSGFVMICTTWKVLDKWLPLFSQYFDLSNMIIWDKGGGGIGDLKHTFSTDYEVILCASNGAEIREKRIGSVWSIGKDGSGSYVHPTQKPVGLSANAIRHTTDVGQSVLDLFGGSGSTLIACEQLRRRCFMAELDTHYCDVIIERWQNFTGETAVLLNGEDS